MFDYLRIDLQTLLDEGISRSDATALVVQLVEAEEVKRKQVIEEAVNIAASCAVSQALTAHRRTIFRRAEKISRDRANGTDIIKEKLAGLMGFRLPSGTALKDATGVECAEAAKFYMSSSMVHYHRANFLQQIADRVGKNVVGNTLQETDLQQAYETAGRLE